mgnify:FL=1|jgi:hypothetical protein
MVIFPDCVFGKAVGCSYMGGFARMRKKNLKGRCEKRMIEKSKEVCKTYDAIQYAYADLLQMSNERNC